MIQEKIKQLKRKRKCEKLVIIEATYMLWLQNIKLKNKMYLYPIYKVPGA